jgi:molybdate-binding protein/DNA-binding transcriptional regulator YhcF (GntR family)
MDEPFLYQKIAETIRQEILVGKLKPGERLPSVREMAVTWSCTLGTAQRAYGKLAQQGLVLSRSGQGTHVVEKPPMSDDTPLRRASLVHRAEAFLLEALTAGFSPKEVEAALRLALDHWRVSLIEPLPSPEHILRFTGSHDMALTWIASHFFEITDQSSLELNFSGSLGGLIALAEGKADLAGCHLWDEETDTYNAPFVRRVLPGRRIALLTLAYRSLGLIVPAGNPAEVTGINDLIRPELRFVNRQAGSGTRVWLDAALHNASILPSVINGYNNALMTHSEVARTVAEGRADVGFGLQSAARAFGLDCILLVRERYDLIIPEAIISLPAITSLVEWLNTPEARQAIAELEGYDIAPTGRLEWVS